MGKIRLFETGTPIRWIQSLVALTEFYSNYTKNISTGVAEPCAFKLDMFKYVGKTILLNNNVHSV